MGSYGMALIKVYLLNFHGGNSHLEIVLENLSGKTRAYYHINRFDKPEDKFAKTSPQLKYGFASRIQRADSTFEFEIEADPAQIVQEWQKYYDECARDPLKGMSNNCADAVEWFLYEFAGVPKFSSFRQGLSQPLKFNHLAFGIQVPAILPLTSLPGRVMDNAKRYIPEGKASQRSTVSFFFQNMSGSAGLIAAGIVLASQYLKI
jgi:hypothetical protein